MNDSAILSQGLKDKRVAAEWAQKEKSKI